MIATKISQNAFSITVSADVDAAHRHLTLLQHTVAKTSSYICYTWCTVFNDVEKPIQNLREAETETAKADQKDAKEEE